MAALNPLFQGIKATPTYLTILLGGVLVGWQALAGALPGRVQVAVFAVLLFGTGIPHGALDHLIDRETAVRQGKSFSTVGFLAKYLLTMAVFGSAWVWFPAFSLALFLLISAWHFGETDIERVPPTLSWTFARLAAGGFVLVFILVTHAAEVTPLLERITHHHALTLSVWYRILPHATSAWLGWGLLTGCAFGWAFKSEPVVIDWLRLARLGVVLVLGYQLPLLLAFSLYFGGWHALSSFQTIYGYLKQTQPTTLTAGRIWLKSLPFTALGIAFLAVSTWGWLRYAHAWDPLPLLFIFLSLITLPHLNVMHGMNSRVGEFSLEHPDFAGHPSTPSPQAPLVGSVK